MRLLRHGFVVRRQAAEDVLAARPVNRVRDYAAASPAPVGWSHPASGVYCASRPVYGDEAMDVKEAIAAAKRYLNEVYADEQVTNLGLGEVEHVLAAGNWIITLGFSRPWNTPRKRAQEVLENLGAVSSLKRSYKVITIADDGTVLSMRNRANADAAE